MDLAQPGIQRVVEAASRKGVALDIRLLPGVGHAPEQAAAVLDADPGQIVKAMVFVAPRPEGRLIPIVCLVSGRNEIDLPLLAAVSGEFAIRAAGAREVREFTGFSPDAIPPFGYARDVRILMDQDLCQYQWIWATAGSDTAVFKIAPRTLRMLSNAVVAPVAAAPWMTAAVPGMEPHLQFEAGTGA
jgi:prolyl-tRNA editing enzyme YbaK/EbsC (Cys-tRNA(Pro) deacylase)